MRRVLTVLAVAAIAVGVSQAADDEKPKYAIKEVMQQAHKDGLLKKVTDGGASKEDKEMLLDLYLSLTENEPPKGDPASWKEKTTAVVIAAGKVVVGRDGAEEALKKTVNCGECHGEHKP